MDNHFVAYFADSGRFVFLAIYVNVLDKIYFVQFLVLGSLLEMRCKLAEHPY